MTKVLICATIYLVTAVPISRRRIIYIIWYIMFKILRIVFSLLAAAAAAVTVMIFVFFDLWGLLPLGLCIIFAVAMFLCRNAQVREELKKNPPTPVGDFITGKVNNNEK